MLLEALTEGCRRPEPGLPYYNLIWANKAAIQRFGQPYTAASRVAFVDAKPPPHIEFLTNTMQRLHELVMVSRLLLAK